MGDYDGDSINFSWTLKPNKTSVDKVNGGLWGFTECSVYSLPNGRLLLRRKADGKKVVTIQSAFQLLQHCRQFRTLDEHLKTIIQSIPSLSQRQQETKRVLNEFIEQGMLQSASDLLTNLRASGKISSVTPVSGVYIRTCDRPAQLKRLLASLSENRLRYGIEHRFVVMDDSRYETGQQQNVELIKEYSNQLNLHYSGPNQQLSLQQSLVDEFPEDKDIIEWLLSPQEGRYTTFSGGRLWNHILLQSAGSRFLLLDDDTICKPRCAPDFEQKLSISDQYREAGFYSDRQILEQPPDAQEFDPIDCHVKQLGLSFGESLHSFSALELKSSALQGLETDSIAKLQPASRILFTRNGVFGDPGTSDMSWIYELTGRARNQLCSNPQQYQKDRSNRCMWLGSTSFRYLVGPNLMTTTLTGVHNQDLLPPASPSFRNEDYFFGALTKFLYPTAISMDFPWGLLHFPEPERQWAERNLDQPKNIGLLGFVSDIALNAMSDCHASVSERRLLFLAETYLSLADAKDNVLVRGIENNLLSARTSTINQLQSMLDIYDNKPPYWADDIKRLIAANSQNLAANEGEGLFVSDLGTDKSRPVETVRVFLRQLGNAMRVWPKLWKYAAKQQED